mmetsp:Transcript_12436/g.16650  ORF Transcript_12436/g.16650 Transcript_12436/m.16650 type:complete len:119 (-) Transcript_12436:81-437(-)
MKGDKPACTGKKVKPLLGDIECFVVQFFLCHNLSKDAIVIIIGLNLLIDPRVWRIFQPFSSSQIFCRLSWVESQLIYGLSEFSGCCLLLVHSRVPMGKYPRTLTQFGKKIGEQEVKVC